MISSSNSPTRWPNFSAFPNPGAEKQHFSTRSASLVICAPHVWILYATLAFYEECLLPDITSFSLLMLENPQGATTPVLYMFVCVWGYKLQNNKSLEGEFTCQIPGLWSCLKVNHINSSCAPFAGVSK